LDYNFYKYPTLFYLRKINLLLRKESFFAINSLAIGCAEVIKMILDTSCLMLDKILASGIQCLTPGRLSGRGPLGSKAFSIAIPCYSLRKIKEREEKK